jgi:hypothetical protein
MTQPDGASSGSTTINNTQVNVVGAAQETALDAARRLAFAIEKAARAAPLLEARATGELEMERKG